LLKIKNGNDADDVSCVGKDSQPDETGDWHLLARGPYFVPKCSHPPPHFSNFTAKNFIFYNSR
jgi:hypothetical protein